MYTMRGNRFRNGRRPYRRAGIRRATRPNPPAWRQDRPWGRQRERNRSRSPLRTRQSAHEKGMLRRGELPEGDIFSDERGFVPREQRGDFSLDRNYPHSEMQDQESFSHGRKSASREIQQRQRFCHDRNVASRECWENDDFFRDRNCDPRALQERDNRNYDRNLASREIQDRERSFEDRKTVYRNDCSHPDDSMQFLERPGRSSHKRRDDLSAHGKQRTGGKRRRSRPRGESALRLDKTNPVFSHSSAPNHQTFQGEQEHFSGNVDESPAWGSRGKEPPGPPEWQNEPQGCFPGPEMVASPANPPGDASRELQPPWWPSNQLHDVNASVAGMLHSCRTEGNAPPTLERGPLGPYGSCVAPLPNGKMTDPRLKVQQTLDGSLDPRNLDIMTEAERSDVAGEILLLLYRIFNGKITPRTMSPSHNAGSTAEADGLEHGGTGFIPLNIEEDLPRRSKRTDAITAGELHEEIQLHLNVSFPSVKALCQLLQKYKNIFKVEGKVDIPAQDDDISQHGPDLEDGELPEKEEEGESQTAADDEPWLRLVIRANFDLILCRKHSSQPDCCNPWECQDLHICRHYMLGGDCIYKNLCKFQHHLNSEHNRDALRSRLLHRFSLEDIFALARSVKYRNDSTMPQLCRFYNQSGCQKPKCPYLHVCENFIQGDCLTLVNCGLSHSLSDLQPRSTLKRFGLDLDELQSEDIELIRNVLCRITKAQKPSPEVLRLRKTTPKPPMGISHMTRPKLAPSEMGDGGKGIATEENAQASAWLPGTQGSAAASSELWQKCSSSGEAGSWTDVGDQRELEAVYQSFLRAARPCITVEGESLEVDFLAMNARLADGKTLGLRRIPVEQEAPTAGTPSADSPRGVSDS